MSDCASGFRPNGIRAPREPCLPVMARYKKLSAALPGLITAPLTTPPAAIEPPFIAFAYVSRFRPASEPPIWQGVQFAAKMAWTFAQVSAPDVAPVPG